MKNSVLLILTSITLALFTVNCGEKKPVTTGPPGTTPGTPGHTLVYGNEFFVSDSAAYQSLLESCNRCGRKWLTPSGGGHAFTKCLTLSSSSPLYCKHWLSQGYLQIEFATRALPTKTTVTLWPKYNYGSRGQWGQSFSAEGTAEPINENKGFFIRLTGLRGKILYVESENTNHVRRNQLDVEVRTREGSNTQTILSVESMPRIKNQNPPSRYSCGERPHDLLSTGNSTATFCLTFGH